jgi:CheY-like chemotaxis protein
MFERQGFRVLTARSGEEGLKVAAISRPDLVITDYEMPGMNGAEVARAIKAVDPEVPVILFSGSDLVSARNRRMVDAFCDKAGSRDELSSTIFRMLRKKPGRSLQPPPVARASDEGRRTVA